MAETYSLLEFVHQLVDDAGLRADFTADPRGTLAEHDLSGLSPLDVQDALVLVDDTRTAEFSLDHAADPAAGSAPPAGDDAVGYLTHYLGQHVPELAVDASDDPDDLPDLPDLPDLHSAAVPDHEPAVADVAEPDGFGHGFGTDPDGEHVDLPAPDDDDQHPAVPVDEHDHDTTAFDEPGSYDEFGDHDGGAADPFDHHTTPDPGHPG